MRKPILLCGLIAVVAAGQAPPFGTELQQWSLQMSGAYAGAGITWVRDSGKFFLMDQGYAGPCRVWKLDHADPPGTIESVPWTFANLGDSTTDIPWSIAWDNDSGCFWAGQIIDGNIYGDFYLLRYVWSGSGWVWGGTARDSWLINRPGVLSWVTGMEKNLVDGTYYAHVYSAVQDTTGLGRFDPYSKSVLGLLPNGVGLQERGLTLVPWDSCYILTCDWNTTSYRKRDSTGLLLAQASASYGPADWALYAPSVIKPEDTVCAYCINSSSDNDFVRVSVGMLWGQLGSALTHSVRPEGIVSPASVVDSGMIVTPRLAVRNIGEETADRVDIHLIVENERDEVVYHDSTYLLNMPGGSVDTMAFMPWVPVGRESLDCTAWTFWSGDSNVHDDTISRRFLVRVIDLALLEVKLSQPGETLNPDTVRILAHLANFGNVTLRFPMLTNIGALFDTVWVESIAPGESLWIASDTFRLRPGVWLCNVRISVPGDLHPENNDTSFVIIVRGTINHDVACEAILVPCGAVDTGSFTPRARFANYGVSDVTCTTYCWIEDTTTDAILYRDKAPVFLRAGRSQVLSYDRCTLRVVGPYMASCSIYLATDQNWLNNARHQPFRVSNSAEYDVLISAILTPRELVDSGAVLLPRSEVFNAGFYTDTFPVYFTLPGGYEESRDIILDAGVYDTVSFPAWRADVPPGSYSATAWTLLEGDLNPDNDTLVRPFAVRRRDIGVSAIFWPRDTMPDSTPVHPRCEVTNYGSTVETFQVVFNIGLFEARETVVGLVGGAVDTVMFSDTWISSPGIWLSRAEVIPNPADPFPGNNVMSDTFWVLGTVEHQVVVEYVIAPRGTLYVNEPFEPSFVAYNIAGPTETFWGRFRLFDPESTMYYRESLLVVGLPGLARETLYFGGPGGTLPVGRHMGWCSTGFDTVEYYFWILPGPGIEEYGSLPVRFALDQAEPSLFRSGTWIRFGLPIRSDIDLALCSADGVLVRTLCKGLLPAGQYRVAWNGKDDHGKACAPGVYYMRMAAGDFLASQKLVKLE